MSKYDYAGLLAFALIFLYFGPLNPSETQSLAFVRFAGSAVAVIYLWLVFRATSNRSQKSEAIRLLSLALAASLATAAIFNAQVLGYCIAAALSVPIAFVLDWVSRKRPEP